MVMDVTTKKKKSNRPGDRSPFFAPTTPKIEASTPGGTKVQLKTHGVEEHKSTVFGASANLMNAIVGAVSM